jgi:serine/threonine-protein kinase
LALESLWPEDAVLRLRTLGGLSIERIGGPSLSVGATSARRRLTLLAVLAASPRAMPRDKLLALFWPESDTDRARHALDQSLYALKRDLKADDLFVGREELSLNASALTSDIADFRAALARGAPAAAIEAYDGPFLDGVFVSGAPDVERWIDEERVRVAQEVEAALEQLATDAAARGDHRGAAEWWRRLAAMDPRKTRVVVALMSELAATGDRAAALRQAETYRTLVRDDLGADPNPAVTALVEQLKREPPATPAGPPPAKPAAHQAPPSSRDAPLAGRYVIERQIGRGGASTVFVARDLRNERRVALKVLRHELGTGAAADRFRQEIAVTANLQHPHILTVHEWGEADDTLYFAMPFVEGESLRERLDRERRLPVGDVVRLAREIASALAYAHGRGIVHRDVKPENILLTSGLALVADFGIARAHDADDAHASPRRTDPGVILGTPAYLSPEQASGEFEVDARSDQYSLACVLYEALAGAPPFTAKEPIELLIQRLDTSPTSLRSRRPDVPEHVDRAILRALSINPAHRFANVMELADALAPQNVPASDVDAGSVDSLPKIAPTVAPTAAPTVAPTGWRNRSVRARALAAVAAVLTIVTVTVAWRLGNRHTLPERAWIVVADVENQTGDSIFNRAVDAALLTGLQQSAYVNVLPRARVDEALTRMRRLSGSDTNSRARRAAPLDERTAREVAEREGVGAVIATSISQLDSSYFVSARIVDARSGRTLATERGEAHKRGDVVATIDGLVRRLRGAVGESAKDIAKHDQPLPLATTRSLEALRKFADGVRASQLAQRKAALESWRSAVALDSDFAIAHAQLGAAYYFGNDRPMGDFHYARALALLDRVTRREQLQIRASSESWRDNREHAIELRQALLAEYPDDPYAWGDIGYDYMRLDRVPQAIDAFQRQLARNPTDANALVNLATAYREGGRWDDARRTYLRAFEVRPLWLTTPNLNHEFGHALVLGGRMDEARALFDTMHNGTIIERAQGERSTGLLEMYLGHFSLARDRFRQALVLARSDPGTQLTQARNLLYLAAAERELGGTWRDSARKAVVGAYALSSQVYFEPKALMFVGKALAREGELASARLVLDALLHRVRPGNPDDRANAQVVAGEIALATGHADSAVSLLRQASVGQLRGYVRESLALALTAAGDIHGAAATYDSLATNPNSWYGYEAEPFAQTAAYDAGRLYEEAGDLVRARDAYARQIAQWKDGDSTSSTLRDTRARRAKLAQRIELELVRPR